MRSSASGWLDRRRVRAEERSESPITAVALAARNRPSISRQRHAAIIIAAVRRHIPS